MGSAFQRRFFDVKIFNPFAKFCPKTVADSYTYHEAIKRTKYEPRILEVENASFCPLVFSCSGGAGTSAVKAMKQLALKISDKTKENYGTTINFIRTKLSFALLKSAIICLRGCRQTKQKLDTFENSISATMADASIR